MTARVRVILDNDFGGDPDGLFQLAHHLLSPSVEIPFVIASKIPDSFSSFDPGAVARGVESAKRVVALVGRSDRVLAGRETDLVRGEMPALDDAAAAVIREALRDDTDLPLFYAAGGGLTTLATALQHEPRVAERLTLVWIGGRGHEVGDGAGRPAEPEFNTMIDIVAAGVVFASPVPIWQVPESTYEQCLVTWTELDRHVAPLGPLAAHLVRTQREFAEKFSGMMGVALGETVVLGDSPLVLLTALRGPFRAEPSSSPSIVVPRPVIGADGEYDGTSGDLPPVRVFTALDMRLMYGDMCAKFEGVGA